MRGEAERLARWVRGRDGGQLAWHAGIIVAGAGAYGAAMGWWRAPEQGLQTAVKLPLIILLTTGGNALLNGMLAPLLGLNLSFQETLRTIVMSSAIAAAILGAFSPVTAYFAWSLPGPEATAEVSGGSYNLFLLAQVAAIAFAGVTANVQLWRLLTTLGGNAKVATRVLLAWLGGNLLLGGELSWVLRPFVGSPGMPIQFLRTNALEGNFFEAVWSALRHFL